MDLILDGLGQAWELLRGADPSVFAITALTLAVAGASTLVALCVGIPLGMCLGLAEFRGRGFFVAVSNAGMGLPPAAVGLLVAIMLWRSGPLGGLGLVYTPAAMVVAQALIATPIVTAITMAAVLALPPVLPLQIRAMGANRPQFLWLMAREARLPLLAAAMAGFGSVISEVGASIMVGGNIEGETRVLTTAMVLEVSRGRFGAAIALAIVLLSVILLVSLALTTVQQRARRR